MTYSKQTWATGDTVTAEKLNHMEDGIYAADTSGDLPPVTPTDNGKLLGVVDGAYALVTIPPANGEDF